MLIALSALIDRTKEDEELLKEILSSFSCKKDKDIEFFLQQRAIDFEKLSKARTYLICDEKQLLEKNFALDQLIVYGYISIALKILSVPEETFNRMRKEIDGFSAKIHGEIIRDFPCYLIGQLSRNSSVPKESLNGDKIISLACDVIAAAVDAVGGRYMMIECHDDPKLISFYQRNSFIEIARIPDEDRPMVQMIRKIQ